MAETSLIPQPALGFVPPNNTEAEQAVLGALLIDQNAIIRVADIVDSDDFYAEKHRLIYESMIEIYSKREPIDLVSLTNRLNEKNVLENIGGRAFLAGLTNSVPTASNVEFYAKIVHQKATLRRLIKTGYDIIKFGQEETNDIEHVLDKAEQALFTVSQQSLRQNFVAIHSILTDAFDRLDEIHRNEGKLRGVSTGYKALDNMLGGLQKSDLIILAARPSMGKTGLALDIARHVSVREKIPTAIVSLEMSKDQLGDRMLCAEASVDLWKMRTGKLQNDSDFANIGRAMGALAEAPLFIDDSASANIMEIRTKARRLQMEHGIGLLIIDYLQLMEGRNTNSDNRVQEIAEISRGLKSIARELNVPVLALSQLSRAVEQQNPPIPKLSHLRESGSIEQDADVVMFIYREEYYKRDSDRKNIADVIIAKHRNGPVGQIELFFDIEKASFKNLEKRFNDVGPPPPEAF
ncbi:MAG: replicative DNA helicase [Candidatus Kerfeldbacteria bacterium]|nr:replicative DNA helicase [Candidatus Kerfeldbacteria bacterium]